MTRFLAGVVATLSATAAVGLAVVFLGLAPVNADQAPSSVEAWVLGTALRKAVGHRVVGAQDVPPPSGEDLASGAEIYRELCARCHGDTGGASSPLGASFYPPAPLLAGHGSKWGERELFWIIKHGIRNTAMPAWGSLLSDEDIHQVAALVKRLDAVSIPRHAEEVAH